MRARALDGMKGVKVAAAHLFFYFISLSPFLFLEGELSGWQPKLKLASALLATVNLNEALELAFEIPKHDRLIASAKHR